jgi:hypothetical protein
VCELRNELEKCPVPDLQVPVVRLIVGDDNLSTDEARQALRQETDTAAATAIHSGKSFPPGKKGGLTMLRSMEPPRVSSPSR